MASLADMRARKAKTGRAIEPLTDEVEVCTDPEAFDKMARLTEELNELDAEIDRAARLLAEGPRRSAEGPDPEKLERREKLRADLAAATELVQASVGKLRVAAIPGGEWARWKDVHPPRENIPADAIFGFGVIDTTALLGDLDKWAVAWNGEPLAPGDWEMFEPLSAELCRTVRTVVLLQEKGLSDAPKLLSAVSSTETSDNA